MTKLRKKQLKAVLTLLETAYEDAVADYGSIPDGRRKDSESSRLDYIDAAIDNLKAAISGGC